MKQRLQKLVMDFGIVGLVLYLSSTCIVYLAILFALQLGWKPSGPLATGGLWVAAYIGTKITQPFRIAGTIAVTPAVVRLHGRLTRRRAAARAADADRTTVSADRTDAERVT